MMTEMGWEVDEEVNQDKIGETDGMNLDFFFIILRFYNAIRTHDYYFLIKFSSVQFISTFTFDMQ